MKRGNSFSCPPSNGCPGVLQGKEGSAVPASALTLMETHFGARLKISSEDKEFWNAAWGEKGLEMLLYTTRKPIKSSKQRRR